MRLGVLDVGSNTVHLLVVDAHRGAAPSPAYSHKAELRLAEHLDDEGAISAGGVDALMKFVGEAVEIAEDKGCEDILAFATSALRESTNGEKVLAKVQRKTGCDLEVLPGEHEAALTFLAVRRWFGWSAGQLLVLDIGGGSLEIAVGIDESPEVAQSLPLGASRLTREWLTRDPPGDEAVRRLRKHVRTEVARIAGPVLRDGHADRVVGTSKTFRQLARICGAAASGEGQYVRRRLAHSDLTARLPELAAMTTEDRSQLPGVSAGRAKQLVAGAVVADAVMDIFEVAELEICPWALREGIILRRLDQL